MRGGRFYVQGFLSSSSGQNRAMNEHGSVAENLEFAFDVESGKGDHGQRCFGPERCFVYVAKSLECSQ